jgi:RNA polymerase sigma-70 factor (ECF subfamily)
MGSTWAPRGFRLLNQVPACYDFTGKVKNRTPSDVIDEYLVLRGQAGETEAFRMLVERWQPRLLRHALRCVGNSDVARDITQETWMAIIRGLSRLDDPTRFRSWAYRIVANKARDWVRREQARRRAAASAPLGEAAVEPSEAKGDDVTRVRAGIARLEPDQRLILSWFYLEGMPLRDIAEALTIPVGTVKSRLFHARAALRANLREEV